MTVNGHNIEDTLYFENSQLTILDQSLNRTVYFQFDQCIYMYIYPVKSVSQSETGVYYTTQDITLGFAKEFSTQLDLKYKITIE